MLIKRICYISFTLWEPRNTVLHNDDTIGTTDELQVLDKVVLRWWRGGKRGLRVVRRYAKTSEKKLLKYDHSRKKSWFAIVGGGARELMMDEEVVDDFGDNKLGLRIWLGLRGG